MLDLILPEKEFWDETKEEFIYQKGQKLQLEHSLVSLSKWESKWQKPFLVKNDKTTEETLDYIKCMTITQNINPDIYADLTSKEFNIIKAYIDAPMTATWFREDPNSKKNREIITAEIIYYWMIIQNIPMECQKWHLNKLLTLIRVCGIKNSPPKKIGRKDMLANRKMINDQRRAQFNTKG